MQLKVDHVTMCGSNLDVMRRSLAAAGLPSDYGGPHANRATHMALVGFEDGSYLELIAPFAPGAAAAGMRVLGPASGGRTRADGTPLQWETATLGTGPAGSLLPFMIQDKTSRALRVQPSTALKGSAISGVAAVGLGVRDLEEAAAQFRKAYGWAEPLAEEYPETDVSLAHFQGTPVILAAAQSTQENWLHSRVERLGECPAAFLLSTPNLVNAVRRFPLQPEGSWFRRRLAWFDPAELGAMGLGVIEGATDSSMP